MDSVTGDKERYFHQITPSSAKHVVKKIQKGNVMSYAALVAKKHDDISCSIPYQVFDVRYV